MSRLHVQFCAFVSSCTLICTFISLIHSFIHSFIYSFFNFSLKPHLPGASWDLDFRVCQTQKNQGIVAQMLKKILIKWKNPKNPAILLDSNFASARPPASLVMTPLPFIHSLTNFSYEISFVRQFSRIGFYKLHHLMAKFSKKIQINDVTMTS